MTKATLRTVGEGTLRIVGEGTLRIVGEGTLDDREPWRTDGRTDGYVLEKMKGAVARARRAEGAVSCRVIGRRLEWTRHWRAGAAVGDGSLLRGRLASQDVAVRWSADVRSRPECKL